MRGAAMAAALLLPTGVAVAASPPLASPAMSSPPMSSPPMSSPSGGGAGQDGAYRLGSQDRLTLRLYEWQASRSALVEWPAFSRDVTVGSDGTIDLPLIGTVQTSGLTTAQLADAIAASVQRTVGLVARPSASVSVSQYRPFYVAGSVAKAGEYPYRPNLTVLQAVAVAGGLLRPGAADLVQMQRTSTATRGDAAVLRLELAAHLARRARLAAEIAGADAVAVPPELAPDRLPPGAERFLDQERAIFEARRDALRMQVDTLVQLKAFLARQAVSVQAQIDLQAHQLELAQKESDTIRGLVTKGLVAAPRGLERERDVAQAQSEKLRLETLLMQTQQEANKTDLSILQLRTARRTEAAGESQQVEARIQETLSRLGTSRRLLDEDRMAAALLGAGPDGAQPTYRLTRRVDGAVRTLPAAEADPLAPGDVLTVVPAVPPRVDADDAPEPERPGTMVLGQSDQGVDGTARP